MPLGAGRVLLHVGAAATVAPVPLATGSWGTLLSEWLLTESPVIISRDVSECAWGRGGWSGEFALGRDGWSWEGEDGMTGGKGGEGVAGRRVLGRSLIDPALERAQAHPQAQVQPTSRLLPGAVLEKA